MKRGGDLKRTPLARGTTPMKRKAAKPRRRPAARCAWSSRCKRRPQIVVSETERLCSTHATATADRLVADWVKFTRDAACVSCGSTDDDTAQWCHIRSRGARYIRWHVGPSSDEPGNSVRMCSRCHQNFTLKPAAWDRFVEQHWPGLWTELVRMEIDGEASGHSVDVAAVIVAFRSEAAA